MLGATLLAAETAYADYPCNKCYGWLWYTEYCTPIDPGDSGRGECEDPNSGWTNCSLSGSYCTLTIGG